MKRNRIKKFIDKVRHLVDKEFAKKLKKQAEIIETLKNLKEQQDMIKEKIRTETDSRKVRKLAQELEVIKSLKKKAKNLLKENKDDN